MLEGKHTLQLGGASSINQSLAELGAKVIKSEQLTVELEDHESNGNQDGLAESFWALALALTPAWGNANLQ